MNSVKPLLFYLLLMLGSLLEISAVSNYLTRQDVPGDISMTAKQKDDSTKMERYRNMLMKTQTRLKELHDNISDIHQKQRETNDMKMSKYQDLKKLFLILRNRSLTILDLSNNLNAKIGEANNLKMKNENLEKQVQHLKVQLMFSEGPMKNSTEFSGTNERCAKLLAKFKSNFDQISSQLQGLMNKHKQNPGDGGCREDVKRLTEILQTYQRTDQMLQGQISHGEIYASNLNSEVVGMNTSSLSSYQIYSGESSMSSYTISLLRRMRDHIQEINTEEINILDAMLQQMTDARQHEIGKQELIISQQAMYITELKKQSEEKEIQHNKLQKDFELLQEKNKKAVEALHKVSAKLGNLSKSIQQTNNSYEFMKKTYSKNEKLESCKSELKKVEGFQKETRGTVSKISSATADLRTKSLNLLIQKTKELRSKIIHLESGRNSCEDSLRKEREEVSKFGEHITEMVKDITNHSGQGYDGKDIKSSQNVESMLDRVKTNLKIAFKDVKEDLKYANQFSVCNETVQQMEHLQKGHAVTINLIRSRISDLKDNLMINMMQKLQASKQRESEMKNKITEKESLIEQNKKSFIELAAKLSSVSNIILEFNRDFLGMREVSKREKTQETDLFKNMESDLDFVGAETFKLVERYKEKLMQVRDNFVRAKDQLEKFNTKMKFDMECEEKLAVCLDQKDEYRTALREEQLQHYKCNVRFYKNRKVLKDVHDFYTYLLDRLVRLHEGIHNLKQIGINLRENLVTVHAAMGHCTGHLQALRHECQGLVSWYQELPNMEVLKRKLSTCEQQAKYIENSPSYLIDQIKQQKEEFSKMAEQEEKCEMRLKKSMTEMIQLTRHFHTLRNSGVGDAGFINEVKNDHRKILDINEVLYDHMQNYISSSGDANNRVEDYINDVNKTSLDFTEQALDFLFQLERKAPVNSYLQRDRTVELSYSPAKDNHHLFVDKIKAGIARLNKGKNALIKKLNDCRASSTMYPGSSTVGASAGMPSFPQSDRVEMEPANYTARNEHGEKRKISPKFAKPTAPVQDINPEVEYKTSTIEVKNKTKEDENDRKMNKNNTSEANQSAHDNHHDFSQIQNDTKHDNIGILNRQNATAINHSQHQKDHGKKDEASKEDIDGKKTFETQSMSKEINIDKIKGLLEESNLEPVKLKPLQEQEEKSDVIKEKMNQIREKMKKS